MLYFIDTASIEEANDALSLGVHGVTSNTSMYLKENIGLKDFVKHYAQKNLPFLSGEVIGTYDEMLKQAMELHTIDPEIVIKINFSCDGLRLVRHLHENNIKTAMTLIFTMSQAVAAINAGADYLFFFIGRNEENGSDGISILESIQTMIDKKQYTVKTVAASIKNLYQLEKLASIHVDYAAIPYSLLLKSFNHPLTESGAKKFEYDYYTNKLNNIN